MQSPGLDSLHHPAVNTGSGSPKPSCRCWTLDQPPARSLCPQPLPPELQPPTIFTCKSRLPALACQAKANCTLSQAALSSPHLLSCPPWSSFPEHLWDGAHPSLPAGPSTPTSSMRPPFISPSSAILQHFASVPCPWHLDSAPNCQTSEITYRLQLARCLAHGRCSVITS